MAADALHEPLAAVADYIRQDPAVRGLLFASGDVLTGSAAIELRCHPASGSARIHVSDLKEEWSM